MRAIAINDELKKLEAIELPEPVPGEGEILIDVVSAGVNPADVQQAAGNYPPPAGASPLPGLEVSGRRRDTGEEVVALLAGGGYAEVVAVPEVQVLPAPPALSLPDAGGIIEVAATVVSNLVLEAGLHTEPEEGEQQTVLIHGGNGGIGSFAIQLARALGARVYTTVGSERAVDKALEMGADVAWNRHEVDVPKTVAELGGVDIILDVAGGPAVVDNVSMLREFGRLVIIGTIAGPIGEINVGALMARRARIIGTTLRARSPQQKDEILQVTHQLVWPLLESGKIKLPVHAHLPLAEAEKAHDIIKQGGHLGKIILDVAV